LSRSNPRSPTGRRFAPVRAHAGSCRQDCAPARRARAAFAAAAAEIRAASGFDRVLVYRFSATGSGEVVGRARADPLRCFMGHRFPSGDVPRQCARAFTSATSSG
jgi:light-regulated signal transduction histidine kinase (bacteriophytochrome)